MTGNAGIIIESKTLIYGPFSISDTLETPVNSHLRSVGVEREKGRRLASLLNVLVDVVLQLDLLGRQLLSHILALSLLRQQLELGGRELEDLVLGLATLFVGGNLVSWDDSLPLSFPVTRTSRAAASSPSAASMATLNAPFSASLQMELTLLRKSISSSVTVERSSGRPPRMSRASCSALPAEPPLMERSSYEVTEKTWRLTSGPALARATQVARMLMNFILAGGIGSVGEKVDGS